MERSGCLHPGSQVRATSHSFDHARSSHWTFRVDSLHVNDDTEIDWKTLPDPDWNLWSAHTLQRRWLTMKKSIKGYEEMSHQGMSLSGGEKCH